MLRTRKRVVFVKIKGMRKGEEKIRSHKPKFYFPDDYLKPSIDIMVAKWADDNFHEIETVTIEINDKITDEINDVIIESYRKTETYDL